MVYYVSEKGPQCCVSCVIGSEPRGDSTSVLFPCFCLFWCVITSDWRSTWHLLPYQERSAAHWAWTQPAPPKKDKANTVKVQTTHSPSERNPPRRWLSPQRQLEWDGEKNKFVKPHRATQLRVHNVTHNVAKSHTDYLSPPNVTVSSLRAVFMVDLHFLWILWLARLPILLICRNGIKCSK